MKKLLLLFLLIFYQNLSVQTVIGSVLDEDDEPLIGATVINTNSKQGVVSDANGNFIINVLPNDFLKLSFIGKKNLVFKVPVTKQEL